MADKEPILNRVYKVIEDKGAEKIAGTHSLGIGEVVLLVVAIIIIMLKVKPEKAKVPVVALAFALVLVGYLIW